MKIQWTMPAVNDLEIIRDFIARDSAVYAASFIEKILLTVEKLHQLPEIGRIVPEAGLPSVRELIFQNYRIIYRTKKDFVQIIAVIHGSRDLQRFPVKPWEIV